MQSDDPDRFRPGSRIFADPDLRPLTVAAARVHGSRTIVSFAEISDRAGAEALRGTLLVVPEPSSRPLGRSEWWDHELIGCEVITTGGERLGAVRDVLHGPLQDTLDVAGVLIPLVEAIVRSVDVDARRIVVDPPPGLLEN